MSAANNISLRIQQTGAEGVRTRLREINTELRHGAPVTKQLKTEVKDLTAQQALQARTNSLVTQSWNTQHQTLVTMSRVMSTVGSVARNMLLVTTALSVATLAFSKNNVSLLEAEAGLARAQRELVAAIQSGDPERIARAQEEVNVFTARVKELQESMDKERITNWVNAIATGALTIGGLSQIIVKIGPQLPVFAARLAAIGAAGWVAAGPLALIAAAVLGIAAAFYLALTPGDQVAEFFKKFFPDASAQVDAFSLLVDEVFTMHIPNAFIFMANAALSAWDFVVLVVQNAINNVLKQINSLISAANAVAGAIGLPKISKIPLADLSGLTGTRIGYLGSTSAAALAGDRFGGSKTTPFAQVTRAGGGGGATAPVINITINGDVSGEEVVNKVRDAMKENLKDRGFNGY